MNLSTRTSTISTLTLTLTLTLVSALTPTPDTAPFPNPTPAVRQALASLPGAGHTPALHIFRGDSLSLPDTISLFGSARLVIGLHGAGMANMVYCPPGTHVLEIALPTPRHR